MNYQPEVRKDLFKVCAIIFSFVLLLVALKMYDAKTNEVAKIGNIILKKYIK